MSQEEKFMLALALLLDGTRQSVAEALIEAERRNNLAVSANGEPEMKEWRWHALDTIGKLSISAHAELMQRYKDKYYGQKTGEIHADS